MLYETENQSVGKWINKWLNDSEWYSDDEICIGSISGISFIFGVNSHSHLMPSIKKFYIGCYFIVLYISIETIPVLHFSKFSFLDTTGLLAHNMQGHEQTVLHI